jgi:hypothetical protein
MRKLFAAAVITSIFALGCGTETSSKPTTGGTRPTTPMTHTTPTTPKADIPPDTKAEDTKKDDTKKKDTKKDDTKKDNGR